MSSARASSEISFWRARRPLRAQASAWSAQSRSSTDQPAKLCAVSPALKSSIKSFLYVAPLPVQQAAAYPETVTRRFVSLADFESQPAEQVSWFTFSGQPAQGLALDRDGNVYLSACLHGQRGLVRITPHGEATLALTGANLVGLAFSPLGTTILATSEAVYDVDLGVEGLNLF